MLRRQKLALELISIGLSSIGAIVGGITLNPIILGIFTSCGVMIQAYLTKSDLNRRLNMCLFAHKNYDKTLIQLKGFLRGIPYDNDIFLSDLKLLDDIISDQAPSIDKYSKKYSKIFN